MPWALVTEDKLTWKWLSHQSLTLCGSFKTLGTETKVVFSKMGERGERNWSFCFSSMYCLVFLLPRGTEFQWSSPPLDVLIRESRIKAACFCTVQRFQSFFYMFESAGNSGYSKQTVTWGWKRLVCFRSILWTRMESYTILSWQTWHHICTQICITLLD